MDISAFQQVNADRLVRWHKEVKWNLLEWCGAMCGEAGEAANVAKKIRRIQQDLPNIKAGISAQDYAKLEDQLSKEVADTIIYGLIILNEMGYDASKVLTEVFNKKSEEYGFPERAPK